EAPDPCDAAGPAGAEWDELLEQGARAGAWWAAGLARLRPELTDLDVPDHTPARLCHLDVCPENVFWNDGALTIIDWENAGPAGARQDLGSTLWDVCQGDAVRTAAFVAQYRRAGGLVNRLVPGDLATARVVQAN